MLAFDGRFDTLIDLVVTAGRGDALINGGPFTLFAPTDDAFDALPDGTVDALKADIPTLQSLLLYHVLEGAERPPLDGIGDMTGPELAALGPDEAQWLLFVSVTKVSEGYDSAGEAFHIGVAGIVVNREDGSILWRSAGSGQASKRGGLLKPWLKMP